MYFKQETIKCHLSAEEIKNKIQSITTSYAIENSKTMFEGKINEHSFTIYQTFDYGPQNQLRPEIIGEIYDNKISLTFTLPQGMKILLIFSFTLTFLVGTFGLVVFLKDIKLFEFPFWDKFWVPYVFLVLNHFIMTSFFNSKVDECIQVFKRELITIKKRH
jgi:hypothetical protein